MEYLEQAHQPADTIRWRLVVKDRTAQNAARAYIKSAGDRAALEGHLTFYWDVMDAWFEEDGRASFILEIRTQELTRSTARGRCAWRLKA